MWYAIQVRTGNEEKTAGLCKELIDSEILEALLIPRAERLRKREGTWRKEEEKLFPGYLIAISQRPDELFQALKKVPELTKALGDSSGLISLYEKEVEFLQHFCGEKGQSTAKMSEGIIIGQKVIITEGPMNGYEGNIRKIDRHKRTAQLEVELFGRSLMVTMGLEIIRKE